ncbi:MAG: LCP family protein [Clostridiaceae bacterium]|nr:LCP family protein [Eubacteriales bacterium]
MDIRQKETIKIVKQKKKRSVWAKLALILGALILLCALAAVFLGLNLLNRLNRPETPTVFADEDELAETPAPTPALSAAPSGTPAPSPSPSPTPTPVLPLADVYPQTILDDGTLAKMRAEAGDERYTHVLLIGVDRRGASGNSRADTLMIATIDRVNKRLKLTSLLRDTLVNIPGVGYGKLNSSAAKGGVALLMQTVNENFHMNLQSYVLVDFDMFEQVIDELGGITVEMSAAEISAANDCIAGLNKQRGVSYLWDGFIFANAGNVKLTGKQALGFARVRHLDSDFNRVNRQFSVLTAVFAKFMKMSLTKQYAMLDKLLPHVETNMQNAAIIDSMLSVLTLDTKGLLHYRAPADELYKGGTYERSSVLFADLPANALAMHQFIFDSASEPKKAEVLKPGESLPPRTPSPTYLLPEYPGYYDGGSYVYPTLDPATYTPEPTIEAWPSPEDTSVPEDTSSQGN